MTSIPRTAKVSKGIDTLFDNWQIYPSKKSVLGGDVHSIHDADCYHAYYMRLYANWLTKYPS